MTDIINLLPDSVANQIAAGEVIQRPASVVKELMENSIDAGATTVQVVVKDGGNTLIQVIDNGKGMSKTDARLSFSRHATSKIKDAADLFSLRTMGFRGEALASIAAVAQVEMRTRREEDSLGTLIEIAGTRVFKQEAIQCDKGTNISVKSLFFNVPARRRFLKSHTTEMMHIRNEFYRIVLVHPEINFTLFDGATELIQLPATNLKGRIEHVFDFAKKRMDQQLLPISASTGLLEIKGFVGRPEYAQKSANQYFFVNGRYMRHPYFHKAVLVAYDKLIKPGEYPNYFIYFETDPHSIDVNVHPSKTEIKFENEQAIWSIVQATVKEALGKFQVTPSLDFDSEGLPEIPVLDSNTTVKPPKTTFNPNYNPFGSSPRNKRPELDWEKLFEGFEKNRDKQTSTEGDFNGFGIDFREEEKQTELELSTSSTELFQYKTNYICTSVKSGLMLIDQHRAHFRVLYDRFSKRIKDKKGISQRILFPEVLELDANESAALNQILNELRFVGFDIELFGKNAFSINGVPSEIEARSSISLLKELVTNVMNTEISVKETIQNEIALLLSRHTAIQSGQTLTQEEMNQLFEDLFQCENHVYTPDGKVIVSVISDEEIERKFR
ncbi:MAG: DNA mismatch repair endonuclease MutL [Bacteroidales bacterium]|nr:DNA mismatch repair endonuclease MutL [Bacteroidales bacterium]